MKPLIKGMGILKQVTSNDYDIKFNKNKSKQVSINVDMMT